MFSYLFERIDVVIYVLIVGVIYMALIYLWRKIAQLETSFNKMEETLTSVIINNDKQFDTNANSLAEHVFEEVFAPAIPITPATPIIHTTPTTPITSNVTIEELPNIDNADKNNDDTSSVVSSNLSKSKLAKMTIEQLKEQCGFLGISTEGSKTDLIKRILSKNDS